MANMSEWVPAECDRCKGSIYDQAEAEELRQSIGRPVYAHRNRDDCISYLAMALDRLSDDVYRRED